MKNVLTIYNELNVKFYRIAFVIKKDTRHERLVQWDSFICNTKVHTIHNKRELTFCCVHHNSHIVSCVSVFSTSFPWSIVFPPEIVRRS